MAIRIAFSEPSSLTLKERSLNRHGRRFPSLDNRNLLHNPQLPPVPPSTGAYSPVSRFIRWMKRTLNFLLSQKAFTPRASGSSEDLFTTQLIFIGSSPAVS